MERCSWAHEKASSLMIAYHDNEWGRPCHDSRKLFEFLCLEMMQAGLSWQTILNKREAMRTAFANFDIHKIANFDENDIARLLGDAGIIRNRRKIEAIINNAQILCILEADGTSINDAMWQATDFKVTPSPKAPHIAAELSKSLKKQGFAFTGPTVTLSFMQACGMVNDHEPQCFLHADKSHQ